MKLIVVLGMVMSYGYAQCSYVTYDPSDRALEIQLQPYIKYSTEQLENQLLDVIRAGIPTPTDIMQNFFVIEQFQDRLEKASAVLRAYHYRPMPKPKTLAKRTQSFEKSIQVWLTQAQKELELLQPFKQQSLRKQRVVDEISAVVKRISDTVKEYKTRKKVLPYMLKEVQSGVDRFNNLQKEYVTFEGHPFDDQKAVAEALKWIDQQKK